MNVSPSAHAATVTALTGIQIESWRLLWAEMTADEDAAAELERWEARRRAIISGMRDVLGRFIAGELGIEQLRAIVDERARSDWDAFRLAGPSGVMFLHQLARHVPDHAPLAAQLRRVLPVPADLADAHARLRDFVVYLESAAQSGAEPRSIQPGRAAFFVSMWWHVQDPERWPGYHLSTRRALQQDALFTPSGDPVEDYLALRDAYIALSSTLRLTSWQLEFVARWQLQRPADTISAEFYEPGRLRAPRSARERTTPLPVVRETRHPTATDSVRESSDHTRVQWLLAKVGRKLGCRVWIAVNDRKRAWRGEALGSLSITKLPALGLDPASQRVVGLIDVVWLKGAHQVAAAFEVEHTTSVYSGLLRMADLAALSPNLSFPLYIVTPEERLEKVRRELARPTFRALELDRRCAFFSSEALIEAAEGLMRFGSGPKAIDALAERVERVLVDGQ